MSKQVGNWIKNASEIVYKTRWLAVSKDDVIKPDGTPYVYDVVHVPSGALIIPITEEGEIYLIRINRYLSGGYAWEFPAGYLEAENSLDAAKRELKEETGLEAHEWIDIGSYFQIPSLTPSRTRVFIATKLNDANVHLQTSESIAHLQKASFEDIFSMVNRGKINSAQTLAAVMKTLLWLKEKGKVSIRF